MLRQLPRAHDLSYSRSMTNEISPGITRARTYTTTPEMRARQLTGNDVFSTPAMIGLMEGTCVELTAPYLDPDEQTVGIHVDVRHLAPTKIGQAVTVRAELLEVNGRSFATRLPPPMIKESKSATDFTAARSLIQRHSTTPTELSQEDSMKLYSYQP